MAWDVMSGVTKTAWDVMSGVSIKRDRKCIIAIIRIYEKSVLRDKHVRICYVQGFGFGWRSYNVGSLSGHTVKL